MSTFTTVAEYDIYGNIVTTMSGPPGYAATVSFGHGRQVRTNRSPRMETDYVVLGDIPTIGVKTNSPATEAGNIISGLHNPSVVACAELDYEVTVADGTLELTLDTSGTFDFVVESPPFLAKTFTLVFP